MNLPRTLALAGAVTVFCLKAAAAEPVIVTVAKAQNKYPPATTVAMISGDDGKTFSRLATVLEEQPITVCSHSLKQLASGRIVLPLNRDLSRKGQPDHWEAGSAYSDDGGGTWE